MIEFEINLVHLSKWTICWKQCSNQLLLFEINVDTIETKKNSKYIVLHTILYVTFAFKIVKKLTSELQFAIIVS